MVPELGRILSILLADGSRAPATLDGFAAPLRKIPLDTASVLLVSVVVTAVVGLLMIHAWSQVRIAALLWWGTADLLVAAATAVALGGRNAGELIESANAAVLCGYGVFWCGIRVFEGRPRHLGIALAGGTAWFVAAQLPVFADNTGLRAALEFSVAAAYAGASAFEIARGRRERLVSRGAAMFLFSIHSAVLAARVPVVLALASVSPGQIGRDGLFAAFALEHLLFTVAAGFILLAMVKERGEAAEKRMASTDSLTGLLNRRAFFERGGTLIGAAAASDRPVALALFDLDDFKSLNDMHGHEAGDLALVAFADVARSTLRRGDLIARIGGEEFACLLPGLTVREGAELADRLRAALEASAVATPDGVVAVTASAGVTTLSAGRPSLDAMLASADRSLYEAKRAGRNRVERSGPDLFSREGTAPGPTLSRPGSVVRGFRRA